MLKKLFFTAAAAAAVSVPLAGVAWADKPSDPGGNGVGKGGVPAAVGEALNRNYPTVYDGSPVTPGSVFSGVAKTKPPGTSLPDAYGAALTLTVNQLGLPDLVPGVTAPATPPPSGTTFEVGSTTPGSVVKLFTPGCVNGKGPRPSVTVTVNGSSESVGIGCNP
jgi:hypothetical protein